MNQYQKAVIDETPAMYKGGMERAVMGEASPRQAIKAFCLRCVGYVRADVTGCTAYKCPLHAYRPFQAGDSEPESAESGGLDSAKALEAA